MNLIIFEHELYSEKDTRAIVSTHSAKMQPFASSTWARFLPKAVRATRHGRRNYHVAVVGSGPAGFYTSKYLFKKAGDKVKIDMFERLPTPFGLVRFGVAPDHPEVKNVINDFGAVAEMKNFKYYGNVEVGTQPSLEALRKTYDAVVLCTGASGERILGIPGEDSLGVLGAPAFVKWYNGHPDYKDLQLPKSAGESAVVLGQGNVALDVARLLVRSPKELDATDMERDAVNAIAAWQQAGLRTVHIVGRRGFVQAAFTNAELRELLTCSEDVLPVVDPDELALCRNAASEEELSKSRMKKRSVDILEKMAANFADVEKTSKRVLRLHFLRSPQEVLSEGGFVTGIRLARMQLQGEAGRQVAAPSSDAALDISCGLVVRSVGFDILPFQGLPLKSNRVPHTQGCVEQSSDDLGGLYVSGWLKRGPQGIIASNIGDAQETAAKLWSDLQSQNAKATAESFVTSLQSTTAVVGFQDWKRLEAEELRCGQEMGKAAAKFTKVPEMLKFLGK